MNALVQMMKYPESQVPANSARAARKCPIRPKRREEVKARTKASFSPDEHADEPALEQECEHPLHRERLADDATCIRGEARPVGAELELHRNAGDDADGKVQPEDSRPEPCRGCVSLISSTQGTPLPEHQEPRQPHRELGKQVVIRDGERELKPMPECRIIHDGQRLPAVRARNARCR